MKLKNVLVTGGSGFIGSALVRTLLKQHAVSVMNIDSLTYAAGPSSLKEVEHCDRYKFLHADIRSHDKMLAAFEDFEPNYVFHLAAETHVDNSLINPKIFLDTNINGTYVMLETARKYLDKKIGRRLDFCFHHISTDEVFGDLPHPDDDNYSAQLFTEDTPYFPSSPYSASKAASDHLVTAWGRSYNIPYKMTNCSNNYGPYQNAEKLIPKVINNAINGKPIPIFGQGDQIRDWLYVEDHAEALISVAKDAAMYSKYNIGGFNEVKNIDIVREICQHLDKKFGLLRKFLSPEVASSFGTYMDFLVFIEDRNGHDRRYAINSSKINQDLFWQPKLNYKAGLKLTVDWYVDQHIQSWK